jgi:septal ring factor EnvC (AmiA/AmiB activator)
MLDSRHLGAHGMGYNDQSLNTLSRKLTPADIPTLIDLLADKDLRVGVQFALASQCEAAILPVREASVQHKMPFFDAEDTMRQIEDDAACGPEAHQRASAMRFEIHSLGEGERRSLEQEAKEKATDDARIQRNAHKMMDPKQAKELTRQEREEVYRRSLNAMGLKEDGPLTPAQKDLVQRMYRTMVLGESGEKPQN